MQDVIEYLEMKWKQLTAFNSKEELKNGLWSEIVEHYTRRNRHYHNLNHLGNLFHLFEEHTAAVESPAAFGFAIFYHAIVYDTLRRDNEEQSAAKSRDHLQQLRLKASIIQDVITLILATKKHIVDNSSPIQKDVALFLDLDLVVLADEWDDYALYSKNIREEFSQHNDATFRVGRKHALQQILSKGSIYYSPHFRSVMEDKARQNLTREISLL